jgi:sialic acid synthase SpsE
LKIKYMPTQFIAEVSSNHHREIDRCFQFIDAAARIGCDAVKFQLFKIDQLFAPEILAKSEEHRKRKDWELPLEFIPELAKRSHDQGIQFSCTPFYLGAVTELQPYVDFYKVASYELLWDDLIRACASTGKPLILSTGMATVPEIQHAVAVARDAGCKDLTLLHCISGYPTPAQECNLAAIETLRQASGCPVGWSDHSVRPGVLYRAVHRWGATTIEFHLDLEGEGEEFDMGHCWLPAQIQGVIQAVRLGEGADGSGNKEPAPSELVDRDWRTDPIDGLRPFKRIRSSWNPGAYEH